MDQVPLVEEQKRDGQKLAEQLTQAGIELTTVFWLKTSEDGQWSLYFASPLVDAEGTRKAYLRLHPVIQRMPQPFWIHPLEVKFIGAKDSLAQAMVNRQQQYPGNNPFNLGQIRLGGENIEGAYIYSTPVRVSDKLNGDLSGNSTSEH
jgi:hypothetical protein